MKYNGFRADEYIVDEIKDYMKKKNINNYSEMVRALVIKGLNQYKKEDINS
jgi:metal-responsive CopG/Arc/MetJ family transcriptional regulator